MTKQVAFLMYHELALPDRRLCESGAGYLRYVVSADEFSRHLNIVEANDWHGWNVSEALQYLASEDSEEKPGVCFTFDDGCSSDLHVAVPLLREKNFKATFYVTVDHLDREAYLTRRELRKLDEQGFEIGSHSLFHRHLDDLGRQEIERELIESKTRLEDIIGKPVIHFSCPGGRVNNLVRELAAKAGYLSLATSRIGMNSGGSDRFTLKRIAIKRDVTVEVFERLCVGKGQLLMKSEDSVLSTGKRLLGNQRYDKLRSTILSLAGRAESPRK